MPTQAQPSAATPRYLVIPGTKAHAQFLVWDTAARAAVGSYPNLIQANAACHLLNTTPGAA
jgi:hypothetical protein